MLGELLFLANQGVEVLRLDAVAFVWKKLGTVCENLPQAHMIIQAYNGLSRIAAPAMVFKSEAIVHPDFVAQYISPDECPLSYNPTLMNLLWESLATREVRLLRHSMEKRLPIADLCTWVNYVRCHDDIGWSFADEDAAELGINGFDHRQFLNLFYTGRFKGSFARGLPFNYNPLNQDMRISGMAASLAGILYVVNSKKSVDFLIETEAELAKVSWPTRKEFVGAAGVVIFTMFFLSLYLLIRVYIPLVVIKDLTLMLVHLESKLQDHS